jgi:type IV pilus assembly protein PilA
MKTMQKGFTLIELMIVVAIIAILAAIAIPQYQTYITKAQFSESQTIADGLKTPIVEYYNQTGQCPANTNASIGSLSAAASYSGKYVTQALTGGTAPTCTIVVTFKSTVGSISAPLESQTVDFTGTNNGGSFTWGCTSTVASKYLPTVCTGS